MAETISVAGIVVATVVALAVAYMHRKQMRQLEVYRQNPEAGLKPPLHPVTAFIKRRGIDVMFLIGFPLYTLVRELASHEPMSRFDVFIIAISTSLLVIGTILLMAKLAMKD